MQKFTIYHPNAKGTGSALSITPYCADAAERVDGHIILAIATQTSTGNEVEGNPTFPRFAWDKMIAVRLDPVEVMEIIRVIRGEQEAINDGEGLWSRREKCGVDVRHHIDPMPHFAVTFTTKEQNGGKTIRSINLTPTEAETICLALTYAMGPMVFGR